MVERRALLWITLALASVMISCIVIPFASETPAQTPEPVTTVASELPSAATVSAGKLTEEEVMAGLSLDSLLG